MDKISIIIPARNEQEHIATCLEHVAKLESTLLQEVIVVVNDSQDQTYTQVQEFQKHNPALAIFLFSSKPGRARAMNKGAEQASGSILLFLHADCQLQPPSLVPIWQAFQDPQVVATACVLTIASPLRSLKLISQFANYRTQLTKIPYGDQALATRRTCFAQLKGYPEVDLLEDILFAKQLKKNGKIVLLSSPQAVVSARKWLNEGVWTTTLRNWWILTLHCLGVSPNKLRQYYYPDTTGRKKR